jgi:predicted transcriptional regulator of viral defense system
VTKEAARHALRALGPIFRTADARAAGVSWRDLYDLRDEGELIALSRGLYQFAGQPGLGHPDFVTVCVRAPAGSVCLVSALSYWDLSDEVPSAVDLAVPKGATRPEIDHPPTNVHVFDAKTFDLGRIWVDDERGTGFHITDRERSIVDAFRLRHLVGDDLAAHALGRYLGGAGLLRRIPRLLELASRLRVAAPVRQAIQLLTA